ncbi:MAG: phenylacetate-CoA oxygenase/reductase subunit PaaK [Bacteroidetes bacterium]|nr:phenylacetate-CoA oxygenase/reductase subunit PaaK [Bacteroidota bacterium]
MLKFFPLTVKEVRTETADCVSVALEIPQDMEKLFQFSPGQYLTFKHHIDNVEVRRSYSICSSLAERELRVAIKKVEQGKFSSFANDFLKPGEVLEVMPPNGKFSPRKNNPNKKHYLAFAAGSGITPIMSIMKSVLEQEPESDFTLVYGNKNRNSIIFREAIEGLKNRYMQRLRVYHLLSREMMDVTMFNGRIDAPKVKQLADSLIDVKGMDEVFICGPETMLLAVRQQLIDLGLTTEQIHIELFSSPDEPKPNHENWIKDHKSANDATSKVSVRLDGTTFDMDLSYHGDSILDAALKHGADLPYACKGGVCSTCRAKVIEGEVEMEVNYALEKNEVAQGYVLTCQSHPKTDRVFIDFDAR